MKLSKKSEKTIIKTLLVLIFIATIAILSVSAYFIANAPVEVKRFETTFIVGENPGFDLNTSILTFGKVPRLGEAKRELTIINTHDFPVEIKIFASKEIVGYLYFDQEKLILEPNSNVTLELNLKIPEDMEFGNYSGVVLAKVYRVK